MNTYYTYIFFAFILLLSNSALSYRMLPYAYSYQYEPYQDNIPSAQMMMAAPNEGDITWSQSILPPLNQVTDERVRRGWGSGRRRRRFTGNGVQV